MNKFNGINFDYKDEASAQLLSKIENQGLLAIDQEDSVLRHYHGETSLETGINSSNQ